mgnify:CR=1 FL=1
MHLCAGKGKRKRKLKLKKVRAGGAAEEAKDLKAKLKKEEGAEGLRRRNYRGC